MFSKPALPAAHFGLLALCAVWLLVGLVGHAPWRGGDGSAFLDWLRAGAGEPLAVPVLYHWTAAATAWLTSPVLALHDGVRLASGVFVALALWFTAGAARAQAGEQAVWPAALTLLGCAGLLVRGHEINPNTAQFAAAAFMLYGLARVPQHPRGAWAIGGGGFLLVLAGGAAEAAVLASLVLILPLLSPAWRVPGVRRAAWSGVAGATGLSALWLAWVNAQGGSLAMALDTARWHLSVNAYFPGILGWFAWPAWPLALWALYRDRRRWREPARLMPLAALLLLLALYSFSADPGEDQGLVLLLPLALLGGAGLMTLRRGAANALLWFAVMFFGFLALVIWVYWSAHDLGTPARLAARLGRLGMADVGSLRPLALGLGAAVTAMWMVFLVRVKRSPLRPMLVWTAGVTFIWTLLFALFQGPLDRRVGYAGLAAELARQVPAGACVETYGVRTVAGGLMAYHSGRDFRPVDSGCAWLLVQIRQKGDLPPVTADWVPRAEIVRPNHRDDHFMLYARR
ncbi:MAG: ArnT family glycosyltransferase [Thiobacillus sp.]